MEAYLYNADLWCAACTEDIKRNLLIVAMEKADVSAEIAASVNALSDGTYTLYLTAEQAPGVIDKFIPAIADGPAFPCAGWGAETETDVEDGMAMLTLYPPDDEHFYDSGEWPKDGGDDGGGEADSPHNCAGGETCLGNPGAGYGLFLENPLTSEGYRYLQSMLNDHSDLSGEALPAHAREWADYYQFHYHKQTWPHPYLWLSDTLRGMAARADNAVEGPLKTSQACAVKRLYDYAILMANIISGKDIVDLFEEDMRADGYFRPVGWYSDKGREDEEAD